MCTYLTRWWGSWNFATPMMCDSIFDSYLCVWCMMYTICIVNQYGIKANLRARIWWNWHALNFELKQNEPFLNRCRIIWSIPYFCSRIYPSRKYFFVDSIVNFSSTLCRKFVFSFHYSYIYLVAMVLISYIIIMMPPVNISFFFLFFGIFQSTKSLKQIEWTRFNDV